jgi:hypothetical protein
MAAQGAAFARVRTAPATAPRARRMTLLDLEPDALDKVTACLDPDDELAASLACRKVPGPRPSPIEFRTERYTRAILSATTRESGENARA